MAHTRAEGTRSNTLSEGGATPPESDHRHVESQPQRRFRQVQELVDKIIALESAHFCMKQP
eukprot:3067136-Alexandrium_andersonii.AAC.1